MSLPLPLVLQNFVIAHQGTCAGGAFHALNTNFVDINRIDDIVQKIKILGTVVGAREWIDAISRSKVTALVDLLWHNLQFRSLIL